MKIIAELLSTFVLLAFALGVAQPVWAGSDDDDSSNGGKGSTVQHWDKIVFTVDDDQVANDADVPFKTELDIKVLDDPKEVADLKGKVCAFLFPDPPNPDCAKAITITDVEYAIVVTDGARDADGKSDEHSKSDDGDASSDDDSKSDDDDGSS